MATDVTGAAQHSRLKFIFCAAGIFICYFYYGILQERITRGSYGEGEKKERFSFALPLVFCMCVANYLYALLMSKLVFDHGIDTTPSHYYAISSLTYLVAMVSSNKALMWVNYPTQVVGKSCKPIPVMILGVLFGRKRYPALKYLFVFLIVAGVALFIYKDNKAGGNEAVGGIGIGELLLVLSLTCDGLTGAVQERMKAGHNTKSSHMMCSMNKWSISFLGAAIQANGELLEFLSFVQRHPDILWQLATFLVAGAFGQHFIFMCVSDYGPLPCSIVTTTRKFFTVLGSVLFFGNTLSNRQWLGTVLVFSGLFLDGAFGKSKPNGVKKAED